MGIYQKPCLGKGSSERHRGLESPYLGTNFAVGTQIAKYVGFFRGRCGGNRTDPTTHTESQFYGSSSHAATSPCFLPGFIAQTQITAQG